MPVIGKRPTLAAESQRQGLPEPGTPYGSEFIGLSICYQINQIISICASLGIPPRVFRGDHCAYLQVMGTCVAQPLPQILRGGRGPCVREDGASDSVWADRR
jgi:hypothetical protein